MTVNLAATQDSGPAPGRLLLGTLLAIPESDRDIPSCGIYPQLEQPSMVVLSKASSLAVPSAAHSDAIVLRESQVLLSLALALRFATVVAMTVVALLETQSYPRAFALEAIKLQIRLEIGPLAARAERTVALPTSRHATRGNGGPAPRPWADAAGAAYLAGDAGGAYLLRTNLQADSAAELWTNYMQLTEAEAVLRTLKSGLSIRPWCHQLEARVKAHILVAFLAYALCVTLKHLLERKQSPLSPARALAVLTTVQSADIVLSTTDGREIRLRRVTTPTPEQRNPLALLGVALPEHLDLNFECSVNTQTA